MLEELNLVLVEGDALATSQCSTVRHPLLMEAVIRFQVAAEMELFPAEEPDILAITRSIARAP